MIFSLGISEKKKKKQILEGCRKKGLTDKNPVEGAEENKN